MVLLKSLVINPPQARKARVWEWLLLKNCRFTQRANWCSKRSGQGHWIQDFFSWQLRELVWLKNLFLSFWKYWVLVLHPRFDFTEFFFWLFPSDQAFSLKDYYCQFNLAQNFLRNYWNGYLASKNLLNLFPQWDSFKRFGNEPGSPSANALLLNIGIDTSWNY